MRPRIDLFHQPVMCVEGYCVIRDCTDTWPQYDVYDPKGVFIGGTNAEAGWISICKGIIRKHNRQKR